MNLRPGDILIVALLAAGFAAVGETALGRCSRDAFSWNESFLSGVGICAALLFPLSLVFPKGALPAELAILAACLVLALIRRLVSAGQAPPRPEASRPDAASVALFAAIAATAAAFVALDLRYNLFWDGFQIWASKAQLLFEQGGLGRSWYPGDTYDVRLAAYPAVVPLYEALLAVVRGGFDFDALKPVFLLFYFSMLVATYGGVRAVATARLALFATLLIALVPQLSTEYAAGGYADMPQAAFVAGVMGAALRHRRNDALPWLVGGLTTVKPEGTVLAVVACLAACLSWLISTSRPRRFGRAFPAPSVAIIAAFVALRIAFVRWVAAHDSTYPVDLAHLADAVARIPHVARVCLVKTLSPRRWGLFWPAFAASGLALAVRGSAREKALVVATTGSAVVLATAFLFTTWPVDLHIDQAYPRLLAQLAPAAAASIAIGYWRALGVPATR